MYLCVSQTISLGKKPAEGGAVQRHGEQLSVRTNQTRVRIRVELRQAL